MAHLTPGEYRFLSFENPGKEILAGIRAANFDLGPSVGQETPGGVISGSELITDPEGGGIDMEGWDFGVNLHCQLIFGDDDEGAVDWSRQTIADDI